MKQLGRVMQVAGVAFCCMWALVIVAFPLDKGMFIGYVPVAAGALLAAVVAWPAVRHRLNRLVQRPSTPGFLVGVVVVGLLLRLATLMLWPQADSAAYHGLARGILSGDGYGASHWKAWLPPGYPALLAGWYAITSVHPVSGYLLGVSLGTLAIVLVYDVGRRALSPAAGRWAAILMAVIPTLVFTSACIHTTPVLVIIVLGVVELMLLTRSGRRPLGIVLSLGFLLGYAALVRPTFLLAPGGMLLVWLVQVPWRRAVFWTVVTAAGMLCVVVPWTVRNYYVLGAFVPVSTNGGYVLYNGMNPEAGGMWARREPVAGEHDELSQDRQRFRAAVSWMTDNPGACVRLMARKQIYMWGTSSTNIGAVFSKRLPERYHGFLEKAIKFSVNTFFVMLLVLVVRSTLITDVWRNVGLLPGLLFVLFLFGVHLFFEVQSRYNIPALPILILVASAGLPMGTSAGGADKSQGEQSPAAPRRPIDHGLSE